MANAQTQFESFHSTILLDYDTSQVLRDRRETLLNCLLYTSPSPRDLSTSRMPSSA